MKKLLIAMTAAAVGTCAWAEGDAGGSGDENVTPETPTITYLNSYVEEFGSDWTVKAPWSYLTKDGETATLVEGELTAGDVLTLNTGSKVLRGAFAANPIAIPDDSSLYFSSTVTFKDPSDTLPDLGASDKFALVVLDNVESVDAKTTDTNTTNLWVIAQYGATTGTKRAYKLTIPTQLDEEGNITDSITDLTEDWLSSEKRIEIRAYKNVMATTVDARAGFLVAVDGYVCKVYASYPVVNGVIDFTEAGIKYGMSSDDEYLGVAVDAIAGAYQERYNNDQLILSLVENAGNLVSVDFQGQGAIDKVALKETATADFGPDALVLNVAKTDGIAFGQGTSELMYYSKNGSVTIKFTVAEGFELSSPAAADENLSYEGGVYTYVYTPTANNQTVTISAFKPVAEVDGVKYETVLAALAAIAENGGTIQLQGVAGSVITIADAVAGTYGLDITSDVILDLNGMKLQGGGTADNEGYVATITVQGGSLTVKDSKIGGAILAPNFTEETGVIPYAIDVTAGFTTIEAGQIGLINGKAGTLKLVGGTYTDVGETFYLMAEQMVWDDKTYVATLTDGVWAVAEQQIANYNVTVSATGATVSALEEKYADGSTFTFTVAADEANGYENAVVTVNGNEVQPVDGQYTVTVNGADVAIVVTASLKTFAVTSTVAEGATVEGLKASYNWGETLSFTVTVDEDYEDLVVKINGEEVEEYSIVVKAAVTVEVSVTKKAPADPIPALPENPTTEDVATALTGQADSAVAANITTADDYNAFKAWAGNDAAEVKASANAWVAYALDSKDLIAADKVTLADSDITVESFGQTENAAAGEFTLEISLKDVTIGNAATKANLLKIFEAVGTTDLKAAFSADAVTTDVVAAGGKAKFTVAPSAATKPNAFFFKAQIKK